jgi:hypothetical protein
MGATYSINVGQLTESESLSDINSVLSLLPDNTQKLISPKDARDAFLSVWADSIFKITSGGTSSSYQYVGIDTGNPENRDIKAPILIGKRSFGGTDVLTDTLLNNSDADIYFYNTKQDTDTQSSTKLAFLSGTSSILKLNVPYIEALVDNDSIDLNIINPSPFGGDINIYTEQGLVSINGISMPTVAQNVGSASNGKILKYVGTYPFGSLQWGDPVVTVNNVGNENTETNIFGDPVLLNGYSLEFTDDRLVPNDIGGVTAGSSFSADSFTAGGFTTPGTGQDWPLSEIIRKILYPFIEPQLELSVTNDATGTTYAEAGQALDYTINYEVKTFAREDNEKITDIALDVDGSLTSYGEFDGLPNTSTSSVVTGSLPVGSVGDVIDFELDVSNIASPIHPNDYLYTESKSIKFINPTWYGFSNTIVTDGSTNKTVTDSINKTIIPYGVSQSHNYTGSGYLYFIYPLSVDLKYIKDPNGFIIYDYTDPSSYSFTDNIFTHNDYFGSFKVFRTTGTVSYTGLGKFEFIF